MPESLPAGLPDTLPLLTRKLLSARMARWSEPLSVWYQPKMRTTFPDLFAPRDMRAAAAIILEAINSGATIGLFGDYDCDGATSVGVMARYLNDLGITTHIRIPDRFTEGYGPNIKGITELVGKGCDLIVILDSGSTAFEVMQEVHERGIRAVIIDHHACSADHLPKALAFVNPNRPDDTSGLGYLCAAGLSFLTCCAIHKLMRDSQVRPAGELPNLMKYLDIAALGTVADVVPLRGFNRTIVSVGLEIMATAPNLGIQALSEIAEVKGKPGSMDLGFKLGPRINAGGRLGDASLGAYLMASQDPAEARRLAIELNDLNVQRTAIEKEAREDALAKAQLLPAGQNVIIVSGPYHEGIVGITAGRIKEALLKPTIVLSETEHGTLKGSGRSMPGFDLGHAIIEAREKGILLTGGGHGMAAGLSLAPDRVGDLVEFLEAEIAKSEFARTGPVLNYDLEIEPSELSVEIVEGLSALEPFGEGNREPLFLLRGLAINDIRIMKDVHMSINFISGRSKFRAPLWSAVGSPLGDFFQANEGQLVDVIAAGSINEFNGRKSVELTISDVRPAVAASAKAAA